MGLMPLTILISSLFRCKSTQSFCKYMQLHSTISRTSLTYKRLKKETVKILVLFAMCFVCSAHFVAQINRPVGTWKDFFPYGKVMEVASSDGIVYARTDYAVFSLNPSTKEINRHNVVGGLSGSNPQL